MAEVTARAARRSRTLAVRLAIVQVSNLTNRLLLLLWQLASRWGQVRPDGVALPFRLRTAALADLAGVQRQSVYPALSLLAQRRLVLKHSDGRWFLCGHPPPELDQLASTGRLAQPSAS